MLAEEGVDPSECLFIKENKLEQTKQHHKNAQHKTGSTRQKPGFLYILRKNFAIFYVQSFFLEIKK